LPEKKKIFAGRRSRFFRSSSSFKERVHFCRLSPKKRGFFVAQLLAHKKEFNNISSYATSRARLFWVGCSYFFYFPLFPVGFVFCGGCW
jgi:hypothetical protein